MKLSFPPSLARWIRLPYVVCIVALFVPSASSSPAFAQSGGVLTNGNAIYSISNGPTTIGSAGPTATFRPEGAVDHLDQNWWWYSVVGDTRERPFGEYGGPVISGGMTATSSFSGDTAILTFTESRFTATYTMTLVDGATPGSARLNQSFLVTNLTNGTLNLSLFNYVDYDLNGKSNTASDEDSSIATLVSPGLIQNVDAGTVALFQGDNPTFYQVTEYSNLLSWLQDGALINGTGDLNNTGLPFGPEDFTAAMQWDLVIAQGGSALVTGYLEIVPEPGSIALLLLVGVGLGVWARKRRKPIGCELTGLELEPTA